MQNPPPMSNFFEYYRRAGQGFATCMHEAVKMCENLENVTQQLRMETARVDRAVADSLDFRRQMLAEKARADAAESRAVAAQEEAVAARRAMPITLDEFIAFAGDSNLFAFRKSDDDESLTISMVHDVSDSEGEDADELVIPPTPPAELSRLRLNAATGFDENAENYPRFSTRSATRMMRMQAQEITPPTFLRRQNARRRLSPYDLPQNIYRPMRTVTPSRTGTRSASPPLVLGAESSTSPTSVLVFDQQQRLFSP